MIKRNGLPHLVLMITALQGGTPAFFFSDLEKTLSHINSVHEGPMILSYLNLLGISQKFPSLFVFYLFGPLNSLRPKFEGFGYSWLVRHTYIRLIFYCLLLNFLPN